MTDLTVAWTRPEAQRAGTRLVVALHGRGADERSMTPLAPYFGDEVTLAAVRGPVALGGGAYTWFENRGIGRPVEESIKASAAAVFGWLDEVADGFTSVHLLGFSGGTAMGGGLLLAEPDRFAGSVLLSGTLPWDAGFDTSPGRLAGRRVFYGHDPADTVIPTALIRRSVDWLRDESGADFAEHTYPGMGHGLNAQLLADVVRFVTQD